MYKSTEILHEVSSNFRDVNRLDYLREYVVSNLRRQLMYESIGIFLYEYVISNPRLPVDVDPGWDHGKTTRSTV